VKRTVTCHVGEQLRYRHVQTPSLHLMLSQTSPSRWESGGSAQESDAVAFASRIHQVPLKVTAEKDSKSVE
jgi:hypothetical protein